MYRWLAVAWGVFGVALAGCGASQQEHNEKTAAAIDSAVASMAETRQQEEREKEDFVIDRVVAEMDEESNSPEDEQGTAHEDEEIKNDTKKEAEDPTEELDTQKEQDIVDSAKQERVEKEKSNQSKEQAFTYYNRGNFAIDGHPGQTVENSIGVFTIEKAASAGTVSVGPIDIQIENVSLVSGDITEEATAGIAGDQVRYVQLDAMLQNTSELPIQFFFAATTIDVNGHQLIAHDMFSGKTDGDYTCTTPKNATLVYMLNESHPPSEQINHLTIHLSSSPMNIETESEVASGTSVDVSF